MKDDKLLHSEKVPAGKRTYFLDVMENFKGDKYLKFTEARANNGEFIRSTLRIFQEDFDKVFNAMEGMKGYLENNHTRVERPAREVREVKEVRESEVKPREYKDDEDLSF